METVKHPIIELTWILKASTYDKKGCKHPALSVTPSLPLLTRFSTLCRNASCPELCN